MPAIAEDGTSEQLAVHAASMDAALQSARKAQAEWSEIPVRQRLRVVRLFRRKLARHNRQIIATIPRDPSETLASEVIPLADAARYLELRAERVLRPQTLAKKGRPTWLSGVEIAVRREPLGLVLLIAPYNYPLLLVGVQALQALVAGNAVFWKPGRGGGAVAEFVLKLLMDSGLPAGLFNVLDEAPEAAQSAIRSGVDKVFLTGSSESGRHVLAQCAETTTPASVELSGCDAFFVLPGADIARAVGALTFGLTFNAGATCMAPRRVFVHASVEQVFVQKLKEVVRPLTPIALNPRLAAQVADLLEDAERKGGTTLFSSDRVSPDSMRPLLIRNATPDMKIMEADVFAPVAAITSFVNLAQAVETSNACRYALTASVFGPERLARNVADHLRAGAVVINDAVAPTADPRLSFGGRGASGFGKTRGEEGLLEMTATKSVVLQRGKKLRHLDAPHPKTRDILEAYLRLSHGSPLGRVRAMSDLVKAATASNKNRDKT